MGRGGLAIAFGVGALGCARSTTAHVTVAHPQEVIVYDDEATGRPEPVLPLGTDFARVPIPGFLNGDSTFERHPDGSITASIPLDSKTIVDAQGDLPVPVRGLPVVPRGFFIARVGGWRKAWNTPGTTLVVTSWDNVQRVVLRTSTRPAPVVFELAIGTLVAVAGYYVMVNVHRAGEGDAAGMAGGALVCGAGLALDVAGLVALFTPTTESTWTPPQ
jgi:hypothetical protein